MCEVLKKVVAHLRVGTCGVVVVVGSVVDGQFDASDFRLKEREENEFSVDVV